MASLRAAGDEFVNAQMRVLERRMAAAFSEAELTKLIDMFNSPTGQAWVLHMTAIQKMERGDLSPAQSAMIEQARAKFCQQVTCAEPAAPAAPAPASK